MEKGLVQVYTGEGKGKTTAAIGLAVRALGQGLKVLLVLFLKPDDPPSGELLFLREAAGLEILSSGVGILRGRPDPEAIARRLGDTLAAARRKMLSGLYDLIILDEINNALHHRLLPLAPVLDLLAVRPAGVELILTGRHAPPEVLARADLTTRMEKVKHPLEKGIAARRGIEY